MTIRAGVLTVSDKGARGERVDTAGPAVAALVATIGAAVSETAVVADEREAIGAKLRAWTDEARLDLILTTGGTGLALRDVTPEATADVRNGPCRASRRRCGRPGARLRPWPTFRGRWW